ncbi:hypothetical protein Vqi01_23590 [Micromonospora qiuiae]|uniref:Beta/gamma crystallin 'Greek key' domain-containing protein n=2 Tax=Micromonospora qiuiae TaxID=502268 RepID=A0ABQ4JAT8_9ACTN|nr:hypothetical protein Vqi01_23590 [Micromonospora qiuiae]
MAAGVAALPSPASAANERIDVWLDAGFNGHRTIIMGNNPDLRRSGIDNAISSLRVHSGRWCLFDGYNYTKSFIDVVPGEQIADLTTRNGNDKISSIRLC